MEDKLKIFLKENGDSFIAFCHGDEIYYVHLTVNGIDYGFAQGDVKWKLIYGLRNENNLLLKFKTDDKEGCFSSWLH